MIEQYIKYLNSIPKKQKLKIKQIIEKISSNDLSNLDCKKLKWKDLYFRVRYKDIRIVFKKEPTWNKIVKILSRWDIYKNI